MTGLPYRQCPACPRGCRLPPDGDATGYCRTGTASYIASICLHRGEEPPVSGENGICNIFFAHCNLQCVFCQNYQISDNRSDPDRYLMELPEIIEKIKGILEDGARGIGFVSPSHLPEAVKNLIAEFKRRGWHEPLVYNTSAYDRVETIESLREDISLYLPDLKYRDPELADSYSRAPDYPRIAGAVLAEMFRQKGPDLKFNDDGTIRSGMIIRHLVLPGGVENSKACLRFIAERLSPDIHISLMAQYHPPPRVRDHPVLGRTLYREEYNAVIEEMGRLGLHRGWIQDPACHNHYLPDFDSPERVF